MDGTPPCTPHELQGLLQFELRVDLYQLVAGQEFRLEGKVGRDIQEALMEGSVPRFGHRGAPYLQTLRVKKFQFCDQSKAGYQPELLGIPRHLFQQSVHFPNIFHAEKHPNIKNFR